MTCNCKKPDGTLADSCLGTCDANPLAKEFKRPIEESMYLLIEEVKELRKLYFRNREEIDKSLRKANFEQAQIISDAYEAGFLAGVKFAKYNYNQLQFELMESKEDDF